MLICFVDKVPNNWSPVHKILLPAFFETNKKQLKKKILGVNKPCEYIKEHSFSCRNREIENLLELKVRQRWAKVVNNTQYSCMDEIQVRQSSSSFSKSNLTPGISLKYISNLRVWTKPGPRPMG